MFSEEIEIVISLLQYVSNSWVCSGGGDGDGSVGGGVTVGGVGGVGGNGGGDGRGSGGGVVVGGDSGGEDGGGGVDGFDGGSYHHINPQY